MEKAGSLAWEPGWVSRDLTSPLTPIIVNGVVFAVSGGKPGGNAVLFAFDALNGRELWSSGETIQKPVRRGGLSAGGTRVYVASEDGTQYAFGFPIETRK